MLTEYQEKKINLNIPIPILSPGVVAFVFVVLKVSVSSLADLVLTIHLIFPLPGDETESAERASCPISYF